MTPNFYFISETSRSLSLRSRSLKKIYRVEHFRANVLLPRRISPRPNPPELLNPRWRPNTKMCTHAPQRRLHCRLFPIYHPTSFPENFPWLGVLKPGKSLWVRGCLSSTEIVVSELFGLTFFIYLLIYICV